MPELSLANVPHAAALAVFVDGLAWPRDDLSLIPCQIVSPLVTPKNLGTLLLQEFFNTTSPHLVSSCSPHPCHTALDAFTSTKLHACMHSAASRPLVIRTTHQTPTATCSSGPGPCLA